MKNFLSKIFNKDKHKKIKIDLQQKKDVEIFRNKYESYINSIQKTLKNKQEITFLHSGHIGDVINILPIDLSLSYFFITGITLNISPTLDP